MTDPFEIPEALRRTEKNDLSKIGLGKAGRKWVMPNQRRVAARIKAKKKLAEQAARAHANDMRLAADPDLIDRAVQRKVK